MNSFCLVARFKIISDQGAFDGPYERSRTMCFRFELLLQSLGACTKFSEKCSLQAILWFWAALPGAQHLERCFAFKIVFHMTRRAFLALRVIQRQGKSWSRVLVKNWCKWFTKMKIAQNLWIRFTPDQFLDHPQVKSYPGMYSLCSSMRFRKIATYA